MSASASVMFRSEYTDRKRGTNASCPSCPTVCMPIEPTPGRIPSQFEARTKRKMVATIGKNRSAVLRSPAMVSRKPIIISITASAKFCSLLGM